MQIFLGYAQCRILGDDVKRSDIDIELYIPK